MRDLIVTENITLDGVIDAAEGWFLPAAAGEAVDRTDVEDALREQRESADGFLTGRVTFEQMRGYWPGREDDESGISEYLDRVHKYVVSTTLEDPAWEPATVLRDLDGVRALKDGPGGDVVATGSIALVHGLIGAGLVDEYRLFVYPVVLGRGRRLFGDGAAPGDLRLVQARPFRSGVVLLRYRAG